MFLLEQLFDAFKGLLVASTWSEQTINDYIIELAEELKEQIMKNLNKKQLNGYRLQKKM